MAILLPFPALSMCYSRVPETSGFWGVSAELPQGCHEQRHTKKASVQPRVSRKPGEPRPETGPQEGRLHPEAQGKWVLQQSEEDALHSPNPGTCAPRPAGTCLRGHECSCPCFLDSRARRWSGMCPHPACVHVQVQDGLASTIHGKTCKLRSTDAGNPQNTAKLYRGPHADPL